MNRHLVALFEALNRTGVEWTLLRVPRDLEFPPGDVDLLVRPEHLSAFDATATAAGFVPLPGWEGPPSLLYFALDPLAGRFLVLDVTPRIDFGPDGRLPTPFAPGVLDRRVRNGEMVTPSPDDAFWLLVLHCLLDKQAVPEHYRARLVAGAQDAHLDTPIPLAVDARRAVAASLREAARAADWTALAGLSGPLAAAWRRSLPLPDRLGDRWARSRRAVTRPALLRRRRGMSVALLGPNGAGKSTLADGIARTFPLPVTQVYMGLWKGDDENAPTLVRLLAAAERPFRAWARLLRATRHQLLGHLVVFDRYTYDAQRPSSAPEGAIKRTYMWLLSRSCPRPDLTLLLDLPGALAHERKAENSLAETEAERSEFLQLRDMLTLEVVDASRSADEVRAQALELIWREYRSRWSSARSENRDAAAGAARVP